MADRFNEKVQFILVLHIVVVDRFNENAPSISVLHKWLTGPIKRYS